MNPNNYCTLEASQRLVAAGIVLETEMYWGRKGDMRPWELFVLSKEILPPDCIPAPSMSGLWRELPQGIPYEGDWAELCITKSYKDNDYTWCSYNLPDDKSVCGSKKYNANPCDALADLLIWVRGRE